MASKKNGNGRKRLSPSVERQIALALVRVIECVNTAESAYAALDDSKKTPDLDHERVGQLRTAMEKASVERQESIEEAQKVLALNGYGDLESIASRVAALENQLTAAISLRDGKEISRLGAALDRAKAGKPPLVVAEKKQKPASTERKPRVAKAVKDIVDAFDTETILDGEGHIVTGIKPDETGKGCLVQFDNDDKWLGVDPKNLVVRGEPSGSVFKEDAPV